MTSEWPSIALSKIAKLRSGFPFKSSNWQEHGVPVIKIANVKSGRIQLDGCGYVSRETAASVPEWVTRDGDVLIAMTGYVGEVAMVRPQERYLINQRVGRFEFRLDSPVRPGFLFYYLQVPDVRASIEEMARGSAQPNLSATDAAGLRVPVPPDGVQAAVEEFGRSIDVRIDNLRATNATLEAVAQALFKSWFVDFDPVHAKAEGRVPEGMDAATAALFPSEFEDSDLGAVPKGWRVESLDAVANYLNGLALQKYPPESDSDFLPVIKIAQLRAGNANGADKASAHLKPEYVVSDGDVLFSWSGSLEVEVWCGGAGALNQHLFKVTSDKVPKWFYYHATRLHLPHFREIAANKATTMGHIQRRHLAEAKVALPPLDVLEALSAVIAPLFESRVMNALHARSLADLRDTLLPRLISGKPRLPETVKIPEDAYK